MHSSYFVLIPKDNAKDSLEARETAIQTLENEQFFNNDGGYFSCGKADWGVVGGRWTGILANLDVEINDNEAKNYRSTYLNEGYEEDAMILSQEILDILATDNPAMDFNPETKKFDLETGKTYNYLDTEVFDAEAPDEFTVKDLIENKKDYLGKYWIVVIDYHN